MTLPVDLERALTQDGLLQPDAVIEQQRDGLSNTVWRVGDTCVKRFEGAEASPLFPNSAEDEWAALTRLDGKALAPHPIAHLSVAGQPVIVSEWLQAHGTAPSAKDIGTALRHVHRPAPTGVVGCDPIGEGHQILATCRDQSLQGLAPSQPDDDTTIVHLHGDPVPGNCVPTAHGLRLVDWQAARSGSPWHDVAIALSPAMRVVAGLMPWTVAEQRALIVAAGLSAQHWDMRRAAYHWRMACHCQWRVERGFEAYRAALRAEITALSPATSPAG